MSIRSLHCELQAKSDFELNEQNSRINEDLQHLLEWLEQQPHLNARKDQQWLLSFIRGCKFSLQRTKEKFDSYYSMRTMIPEFFSNRDPALPEVQEVLKTGCVIPLPKTADPAGPRVFIIRCLQTDHLKISFIAMVKMVTMIADILLKEDDNFVIAGVLCLLDLRGMTLHHAAQVTPSICKKGIICLEKAYPVRIKGVYIINAPYIFESVMNLSKPLLPEKLKNRLHVSSGNDMEKIYPAIPRSVLPVEYGGDETTLEELTLYWKKKIESYRNWFLEEASYCSNEKLRPGKPHDAGEMFGVEGSFIQLTID